MSAQPVWEQPNIATEVAPERHLRLVTDVADAGPAMARSNGGGHGRMRLTRRGRLSITIASTVSAVVLAAGMVLSGGAANATTEEVVVQPGQTLSQIAAAELPDTRLDMAIVDIQLANNMSTDQVRSGQTLVIPADQGFHNG
ncbi:LysM peptidoglycan-binding domain-containing protein [Ornithinimicrobium sp. INDO-MA30-4]|uniref:LysM peptidoglycan-binding domain-containing protein n=1 Tax=Ornithinimicrobium sp. INDO-MA30-4 TaxID=2908651 RepID=UPI001F177B67|nr:LysM peptidoglycan-binding domain-containing protein [Ornithinimicrobium sp. INDO-MA30-4]UJH71376.1 LysM peptidoglycan-binding domain-containing protein [Ornithinimicrobium sp. INDO-MA30-4]